MKFMSYCLFILPYEEILQMARKLNDVSHILKFKDYKIMYKAMKSLGS